MEFQRQAMQIIGASVKLHLHPYDARNSVLFLMMKNKAVFTAAFVDVITAMFLIRLYLHQVYFI